MKTFALMLSTAALLGHAAVVVETGKGYDTFKGVRTRNIFDPNRKAFRETPPVPTRSSTPSRPRSSSFTLTGTMVREGRSLAFFSGSRSEFSKVISVGDAVANFKVTSIEPAQVQLEHDGKKVTLAIGKPFQIEGQPGDPETPEEPAPAADGPTPAATSTSAPPAPAGGDAKSEILRRMMERRAKELNK